MAGWICYDCGNRFSTYKEIPSKESGKKCGCGGERFTNDPSTVYIIGG